MPKFLSRQDQKIAEILTHFKAFYESKIDDYEENEKIEKSTKFMRTIKMARTYTGKVAEMLQEGITKDQQNNIDEMVSQTKLSLDYTDQARKKKKKMRKTDDITAIETDDLYDIINFTLYSNCRGCDLKPKDKHNCDLKELLMKYDIPVVQSGEMEERCPFEQ